MQFEIIGTGAIGLLFAAKLKVAGYAVRLWATSTERSILFCERGITYYSPAGEVQSVTGLTSLALSQHVENELAITDSSPYIQAREGVEDSSLKYILLAVKQSHLDEALLLDISKLVTSRSSYSAVIAIQNGCGHIDRLAQHINIPIITAVTSEASKRIETAAISHTGQGETWIGDELGRDNGSVQQKNIENALQKAGFKVFMSKNIKERVYRKLISNAVVNPLTALFDVTNGDLPNTKSRLKLMESLFLESKRILMAEEPALASSSFNDILSLCRATASNTSSMRADLLAGVKTEIAYINGAIVAIAARHQMSAPLNESIVHMIEALHPDQ